jgi:hypothetical protein
MFGKTSPGIKNTDLQKIWSGETQDSLSAWYFNLNFGGDVFEIWGSRGTSSSGRAFAVRSRRQ